MKIRKIILTMACTMACSCILAQSAKVEIKKDRNKVATNYTAYPGPQSKLTPAPKGYEPVYLSHYGRHGSRYHIGSVYTDVSKLLLKADSLNILTSRGKELLTKVIMLRDEADGRDGELTELGAEQHQGIAKRMYENFPEIFSKPIHIDAKSTIVIRCILSMENALQQLKSMNPKLDIRHDASHHDMYFMNQSDDKLYKMKKQNMKVLREFQDSKTHPERLMAELFTDKAFYTDSIKAGKLMSNIYKLACNIQSSEIRHKMNLWDFLTEEECYNLWQAQNAYWYVTYGPSKLSGGVQPFSQRNLLRNIICSADSCLAKGEVTAHLRYGHDTMVMPLTCLLELDNTAQLIDDLSTLPEHEWNDYKIFPMACNIQFVFYRNKKDKNAPVLVKVLRNENEARLPMATDKWPYYKWEDVKAYYINKLDSYKE